MSGYDNTNRGSLWASNAFSGNANIDGTDYQADVVATNAKAENAPSHTLYLRNREGMIAVPLWRPRKPDAKYAASGKIDSLGVVAFAYRNVSDNPKAPPITLSFVQSDSQVPPSEHKQTQRKPAEDTPF